MNNYFPNLVGQHEIKRKLSFYIDGYKKTQTLPFILANGSRGYGKSQFMQTFSRHLLTKEGKPRPMVEINSATIKSAESFFAQIFLPFVAENECTLFFDECHALPESLVDILLTVLNTEHVAFKEIDWRGQKVMFDFTRINIVFATTELDKLFSPLKDRLTIFDFQPYTREEVAQIIGQRIKGLRFEDGVLALIADTCRGNARSAVLRVKEIETYCSLKGKQYFSLIDWGKLKYILGIKPLGITNLEMQVLEILQERGRCSLQALSAVTGMSRSAIQHDVEIYLLQRGLMRIEGQRMITREGLNILLELEEQRCAAA